jgi:hypothetical protein
MTCGSTAVNVSRGELRWIEVVRGECRRNEQRENEWRDTPKRVVHAAMVTDHLKKGREQSFVILVGLTRTPALSGRKMATPPSARKTRIETVTGLIPNLIFLLTIMPVKLPPHCLDSLGGHPLESPSLKDEYVKLCARRSTLLRHLPAHWHNCEDYRVGRQHR